MTKKKSSSKTPASMPENLVVETAKPSSTPKKPGNEIDEIFSAKKRKRAEEQAKKVVEDEAAKLSKTKRNKKKGKGPKEREFLDPQPRPRKKTGDGLVIYTEDELGFGKADAGGTPLCPFDCECCF